MHIQKLKLLDSALMGQLWEFNWIALNVGAIDKRIYSKPIKL